MLRYYSSHYECVREDILAISIANTYCHDMLSHRRYVLAEDEDMSATNELTEKASKTPNCKYCEVELSYSGHGCFQQEIL